MSKRSKTRRNFFVWNKQDLYKMKTLQLELRHKVRRQCGTGGGGGRGGELLWNSGIVNSGLHNKIHFFQFIVPVNLRMLQSAAAAARSASRRKQQQQQPPDIPLFDQSPYTHTHTHTHTRNIRRQNNRKSSFCNGEPEMLPMSTAPQLLAWNSGFPRKTIALLLQLP
jgi:hypothetical protein